MENIDDVREYVAAKAEAERDKKMISKEIDNFANEIKNGLGEKIKRGVPAENENKFMKFLKRLFNTCQ